MNNTNINKGIIIPRLPEKLDPSMVAISTPRVKKNSACPNNLSGPTLSSMSSLYGRLPTEIPAKNAPASGEIPIYPQIEAIPIQYPSALTNNSSEERNKYLTTGSSTNFDKTIKTIIKKTSLSVNHRLNSMNESAPLKKVVESEI